MAESQRTALVLGASGTLGGAIARELLARNFELGLHYHTRKEACDSIATAAAQKNLRANLYAGDFQDPLAPSSVVAAFLKDFQKVDAVIWAAGIVRDAPLLTLKEDDLRSVINVDLKALFGVLKALSRQFIKQKSGSVVALSSHAGIAGRGGGAAYAMAHSGMIALVKSTAREWGSTGIRVNAVLPPFVPESAMGRSASPEFAAEVKARRALKTDIDGAAAVGTFVADLIGNPGISGQVLSVDSRI